MATILSVDGLSKRYGGLTAVNGIDLAVEEGSITGLIGPNGAGKTTTFDMIAGAQKPSGGRILFRGQDVTGWPTHRLFGLGIVRSFQIPKEYARLTVLENLMIVPPDQPGESVWYTWFLPSAVREREAAVMARAEETLDFLGLSRLRDERAGNCSGGQKKLLELGRAMMTDARLVLLDEPGAGVNPTLMNSIAEMIERLNRERGLSFFVIEHDMDLIARLCNPVIVLAEGRVLTRGPMATVREDARVIDAYFGGAVA
ncbi:MAG: ABC transporter ATP-binding protein [Pseudomonadota bacterium]